MAVPTSSSRPLRLFFSADETGDVGIDDAMPMTEDYKKGDNAVTGKIWAVRNDVKETGADLKAEAAKPATGAAGLRSWRPRSRQVLPRHDDDGRVDDVEDARSFHGVFQGAVGGRSSACRPSTAPAASTGGTARRSALAGSCTAPGIQSSDTVGTDTGSLSVREGATSDRQGSRERRRRSVRLLEGVAPSLA
jgi:hypothetical protein